MQANPELFGSVDVATLNPDELAETLWRLYLTSADSGHTDRRISALTSANAG
jgi:hypothetical protein